MKPSMRNKFKGAAKKVIAVNRVRKAKPTMVERHGGVWGFLSFVLFLLWSLPSAIYRHRRWLKANPGAGTTTTTTAHPRRALLQTPTTADVTTVAELRAAMADTAVGTVRLLNSIALDDNNGELPAVTRPVTVSGDACASSSPPGCAIDALAASRHVTVGATGTLTLTKLALVNGAPPLSAQPWSDGGAVFVYGKLVAVDVAFRTNKAIADGDASAGGAVKVQGGVFTCERCAFIGNVAAKNGGAVAVDGDLAYLLDSSFSTNAAGALGAGIASDNGDVVVRDCTFDADNTAREDDSVDLYVGAFGRGLIWPFAVTDGVAGATGYNAAGLGVIDAAPFEAPPPGSVSPPPPPTPPPGSAGNGTEGGAGTGESTGDDSVDLGAAVSGIGVEGVVAGIAVFFVVVALGAWAYGRDRRRYRQTERDLNAQHAKMERAIARREEDQRRLERGAIANQAPERKIVAKVGGDGKGRRGGARGAFEPRRPGGDDEEPERDGLESDDEENGPVDGVYDAEEVAKAPRDSAWSLAGHGSGTRPDVQFGARGWDAGKAGFTQPQWAGAASAARRAAEGARGGLPGGSLPPLGQTSAPRAVTPRDHQPSEGELPPAPAVPAMRRVTSTSLRDQVAQRARTGGADESGGGAPRFGAGGGGGGRVPLLPPLPSAPR